MLPTRRLYASQTVSSLVHRVRLLAEAKNLPVDRSRAYTYWIVDFLCYVTDASGGSVDVSSLTLERMNAYLEEVQMRGDLTKEAYQTALDAMTFLFGAVLATLQVQRRRLPKAPRRSMRPLDTLPWYDPSDDVGFVHYNRPTAPVRHAPHTS